MADNKNEQNFIKKLLETLNNFQKLAKVFFFSGVAGLVAAIYTFIMYEVEGVFQSPDGKVNQIYGAFFFILLIIFTIASIVLGYLSFPYMTNKVKQTPNKYLGWLSMGLAALGVVLAIMAILVIPLGVKDYINDEGVQVFTQPVAIIWIVSAIFFLCTSVVNAFTFFPAQSVKSFMPSPVNDELTADK